MIEFLINFFMTCSAIIFGGVVNMFFVRIKWFKKHAKRLDRDKKWEDGKAIFGKNKTDLGFIGMMVFTMVFQVIIGVYIKNNNLGSYNLFYDKYTNSVLINAILGLALGMCYMIFELPNSFIKRRINIEEGTTEKSKVGRVFFIIDQIDSLIGIGILIYCITSASLGLCVGFVCLGGFIHIVTNVFLYLIRVRKNI